MPLKHPLVKSYDCLGKLVLVRDLFVATRPDRVEASGLFFTWQLSVSSFCWRNRAEYPDLGFSPMAIVPGEERSNQW